MASDFSWYLEGRIIYARVAEDVTLDDLHRGNAFISSHLEAAKSAPVHVLFDLTGLKQVPLSVAQIKSVLGFFNHPALGWNVTFGSESPVHVMVHLFGTVMAGSTRMRFRMFNTLDEALDFLQNVDSSLPNPNTSRHED